MDLGARSSNPEPSNPYTQNTSCKMLSPVIRIKIHKACRSRQGMLLSSGRNLYVIDLPSSVSVFNSKFYQNQSSSPVAEIGRWSDKDKSTLFPCMFVMLLR
jgi:hypothetical protein